MTVNTSLGRSISLGDSRRVLEFRAEAHNALNSVSITRIGATVNSSSYGLAAGAGGMRAVTLNLRLRF